MKKIRGIRAISLVGTLVGGSLVLGSSPALAACSTETKIQWTATTSGLDIADASGMRSSILVANRDLNTTCASFTMTGSTSLLLFTPDAKNWVEVGWREGLVSGSKEWHWFTELGINGNATVNEGTANTWPCPVTAGLSTPQFMDNGVSNNTWNLDINCSDGTGNNQVHSYSSTGFSQGRPQVEVFRFDGTATGASDIHTSLQWKDPAGFWNNWTGGRCFFQSISNWQGEMPTNTTFDTFKTTIPVC